MAAVTFPIGGTAILQALYETHRELAFGSEDDRRALTIMMAETLASRLDPRWGVKKAGPTNPQSKDTLAYDLGDGSFAAWDWQNGATRALQIHDGQYPTYPRIANQTFIPVTPVDHLEASIILPPPVATPSPPPVETQALAEALRSVAENLQGLRADLALLNDVLTLDTKVIGDALEQLQAEVQAIRETQQRGLSGRLAYTLTLQPPPPPKVP